jgi:hypothetical protein
MPGGASVMIQTRVIDFNEYKDMLAWTETNCNGYVENGSGNRVHEIARFARNYDTRPPRRYKLWLHDAMDAILFRLTWC